MRNMRLALFMLGGCSFAFVRSAPDHASWDAACTESRVAPIADALLAAGAAVGGVAALVSNTPCNGTGIDCIGAGDANAIARLAGIVLIATSLTFAGATYHGISATADCRALHSKRPAPLPRIP